MEFKSLMHISFFAKDMDAIRDFYENKLGCPIKMGVKFKRYANKPGHGFYQKALTNPEDYCIVYYEIAPGQFVEFFPYNEGQAPHPGFNEQIGYSHFGLLVEDIHKTRDELVAKGIGIDSEPTIGNSHTWQMWIHDPEGNKIEVMQYTPESYQITGHIDE